MPDDGREPDRGEHCDIDPAALREAAVRLLAGREHSRRELSRKLLRKGWPKDEVDAVIDELAGAGLQSDQRFAEMYARQRAAKAYGPLRIRAELGERGIDRDLVEQTLRELDVDFHDSARNFYRRRYGGDERPDYSERARRAQALSRRGFAAEHLRWLLDE